MASRDESPPGELLTESGTVSDRPFPAVPLAFGIGAVALGGAALGFHLWGNSLHDEAVKLNTAATRSEAEKKYDAATTRRYLAQGFGVAAVGCAGLAVYFYLSGRESRPAGAAIAPMVSPDLAGLAVAGRW